MSGFAHCRPCITDVASTPLPQDCFSPPKVKSRRVAHLWFAHLMGQARFRLQRGRAIAPIPGLAGAGAFALAFPFGAPPSPGGGGPLPSPSAFPSFFPFFFALSASSSTPATIHGAEGDIRDREEWDAVGLLGQLRMKKGQKTGTNWIKMRDISDTVEEWLVR